MSLRLNRKLVITLSKRDWNLYSVSIGCFSTTSNQNKAELKNKFKKSSHDWLTRQMNDPYVKLAMVKNYRARSAFKIIEINDQHKIFRPGMTVVECGCAPGAWTEAIVPLINSNGSDSSQPKGTIIALDKTSFTPVEGAITLPCCDFTLPEASKLLKDKLQGKKVDVVLSDMAPNASGNKSLDHDCIIELASLALKFSINNSCPGATFLCKIWDGHYKIPFRRKLELYYKKVSEVKPPSSRSNSSELFYLAKDFKTLPPDRH